MTSDEELAKRIRMIANHGQERKYHHKLIGCNSRLDTLHAAVLDVKLKHIDEFTAARQAVAAKYDEALASCGQLILPRKSTFSTHVYHQYTVRLKPSGDVTDTAKYRESLQASLKEKGIPTMVYYPLPLQAQEAYKWMARTPGNMDEAARLSQCVLSLPIHTEMTGEELEYIIDTLLKELQDRKM